jgi:hypothetical protein
MDGSTDLICLNCLTTVSTEPQEDEFAPCPHVCHSFLTARTNRHADAAKIHA